MRPLLALGLVTLGLASSLATSLAGRLGDVFVGAARPLASNAFLMSETVTDGLVAVWVAESAPGDAMKLGVADLAGGRVAYWPLDIGPIASAQVGGAPFGSAAVDAPAARRPEGITGGPAVFGQWAVLTAPWPDGGQVVFIDLASGEITTSIRPGTVRQPDTDGTWAAWSEWNGQDWDVMAIRIGSSSQAQPVLVGPGDQGWPRFAHRPYPGPRGTPPLVFLDTDAGTSVLMYAPASGDPVPIGAAIPLASATHAGRVVWYAPDPIGGAEIRLADLDGGDTGILDWAMYCGDDPCGPESLGGLDLSDQIIVRNQLFTDGHRLLGYDAGAVTSFANLATYLTAFALADTSESVHPSAGLPWIVWSERDPDTSEFRPLALGIWTARVYLPTTIGRRGAGP